jgi:hypothetical protein
MNSFQSASFASASYPPFQPAVSREDDHRKAFDDAINNPISWYHSNNQAYKYAGRSIKVALTTGSIPISGSKEYEHYKAVVDGIDNPVSWYHQHREVYLTSSLPISGSPDALRSVNSEPQTQLPHMPGIWPAR